MNRIPILEALEKGDVDRVQKMIEESARDPVKFAEYYLGVKLFDYQQKVVRSNKRFIIWVAGRQCFEKDEFVYTKHGVVKASEIHENIVMLDGSNVSDIHEFDGKGYIIKFCNGIKINVSENHLMKTLRGWVPARHLRKGDFVEFAKPDEFEIDVIRYDPCKAKMLGYLLSDGYFGKNQSPKFTNNRMDFHKEVEECARRMGLKSKYRRKNKGWDQHLILSKGRVNPLVLELKRLGLYDKDSFGLIQRFDEQSLIAFIQGYFNGDGYLTIIRKGNRDHDRVEIGFSVGKSRRRAYELQFMLWRLGIESYVKPEWHQKSKHTFYRVVVSRAHSIERLIGLLDWSKHPEKFERALEILSKYKGEVSPCIKFGRYYRVLGKEEVEGHYVGWSTDSTVVHSYMGMVNHNSGKSLTISILALWQSLYGRYIDCARQVKKRIAMGLSKEDAIKQSPACRRQYLIIIVSPSQRQSMIIYNNIRNMLESNPLLMEMVKVENGRKRILKDMIEFDNGSRIMPLPSGRKGATVRGFSPNLIIFDEAAFMEPEVFEAILPSGAASEAKVIMISTPLGRSGYFWEKWNDSDWEKFHTPSYLNPIIANDPEFRKQMEALPEIEYRREYLGEFADYSGTMFTWEEIEAALTDDDVLEVVDGKYYISVDVAGSGKDSTVAMLAVVKEINGEQHVYVKEIWEYGEGDFKPIIRQVKSWAEVYRPVSVLVDSTGLGYGLAQMLRDEGLPVVAIHLSAQRKTRLLNKLKSLFEMRRIHIPRHKKLIQQLKDFLVEETESGNIRMHGKQHDDYVMALTLLAQPIYVGSGRVQLLGDLGELVGL